MKVLFQDAFQRAGINSSDNIVTYENTLNTRFGSSSRGYFILKTLGHNSVQVLDGGMDAWLLHKQPTDNLY
jgi:thiosulfate/3-mercaptopyruvate sulfurtransferase